MRPPLLNPLFAALTSLPGIGPKLEKLYARLLDRETPRARRPAVPSAVRRDRPPRAAETARRRCPARSSPSRSRSTSTARPAATARARPTASTRTTTPATLTLTFFNARRDYLEKLLPEGETRYVSGTAEFYDGMLQMVHPDRVVDEKGFAALPLVEPVYPLTEGLALGNVRRAMDAALAKLARSAGMAGRSLGVARAACRLSPMRCARCIARPSRPTSRRRASPGRGSPMTNCWPASSRSRLVRAHHAPRSRAAAAPAKAICARKILKALPYSLTHSQQKAVDDIVDRSREARNACCACCRATSAPARPWSR